LDERVRVLMVRGKGWHVNWPLVDLKPTLYNMTFSPDVLEAALSRVGRDWSRDVCPLLPQFVAIEDERRAVEAYLGGK
jgi:hypothetical protein